MAMLTHSPPTELTLAPARAEDLGPIMAIERSPGFERWVGRSSEDEHRAMMAAENYAYLVGRAAGTGGAPGDIAGFAILRDLEDPHGNLYLKRIAVAPTDAGLGSAFLALVVDWTFAHEHVHRFWLDCFASNARAQRVYEKCGFSRDGVLREAYRDIDGLRRDLTMMALTRPQWLGRRR
ncbi:MAG: N-acetyltransferase [Bradyrhizobium sp.]|nr:MAG: N-acetyltransferase [Bradyrhizobium sp.]